MLKYFVHLLAVCVISSFALTLRSTRLSRAANTSDFADLEVLDGMDNIDGTGGSIYFADPALLHLVVDDETVGTPQLARRPPPWH